MAAPTTKSTLNPKQGGLREETLHTQQYTAETRRFYNNRKRGRVLAIPTTWLRENKLQKA